MDQNTKEAIRLTEQTLEANEALQGSLDKYIADLESEQERLDTLIKTLSKVEACLPEEQTDYYDEVVVETAAYGENYESLRHALTAKQLASESSPFYHAVQQRQRYETLTTTRPFTREEQRILHVSIIIENKRLHALRARARGEDPFAAVQGVPDSFFDRNDPEISWSSVAQNMVSNPPRTADQCRIMYVSTECPSINRSDWTPEELESLRSIVKTHNEASAEPVEDIEMHRERLRVDWVDIARDLGTNRTALQCLKKFVLEPSPGYEGSGRAKQRSITTSISAKGKIVQPGERSVGRVWTKEEDTHLLEGVQRHGMGNWPEVALHVNSAMSGTPGHVARTPNQCSFRYTKSLCPTIKKGRWSAEEDEALRRGVAAFGRTWIKVQEYVEGRTDAQCRERWSNALDPSLKLGPWDPDEDKILLDAASRNLSWSAVSALLPGRTDTRCAKRYQILLKEQESGQANASAPIAKKYQKRSKKHPQNDVQSQHEVMTFVNTGGSATPSAGIAPSPARVTNEVPVVDVSATRRRKSGRNPRAELKAGGGSSMAGVGGVGLDIPPASGEVGEQQATESVPDAADATSMSNSTEATVSKRTKPAKGEKGAQSQNEDAHTGPSLRRSARVASKT